MSDFSNFRAVYNELTDAVTSARYQFFKDPFGEFLPMIMMFADGRAVAHHAGAVDSDVLRSWILQHIPQAG